MPQFQIVLVISNMLFFEFAHIWNCNHQKATWCHHLFNNGTFRFLMKYMSVIDLRHWRKGWNVRNCVTLIIISRSYQTAYWNVWWFSNYLFILNTNNIFKVCYSIYLISIIQGKVQKFYNLIILTIIIHHQTCNHDNLNWTSSKVNNSKNNWEQLDCIRMYKMCPLDWLTENIVNYRH